MITRIEAQGYKCLRDVDVHLGRFNVLVGPNASGKSTLLDVLGFLRDALRLDGDVSRAVRSRARSAGELLWRETGEGLQLAIALEVPEGTHLPGRGEVLRYVTELGTAGALTVAGEALFAANRRSAGLPIDDLIGRHMVGRGSSLAANRRLLLVRSPDHDHHFVPVRGKPWRYRPASDRLALSLVPDDPEQFPEATWLRDFLHDRVHMVELSPRAMQAPCPPEAPLEYESDGSNVPLLIQQIRDTERFEWWIEHLRLAMRGLRTIEVVEQEHDRHLYIVAVYDDGLRVPAWRLSDGTLRFLALTLIAYLPPEDRVFIIEEPENGMHPKAIEYLMQSLTSVYEGQVFLATHSPIIVGLTDPENLLCFSQDEEGATQIIRGSEHPELQAWREGVPLSDLFAAGVLG